jgi:hypothetical protein
MVDQSDIVGWLLGESEDPRYTPFERACFAEAADEIDRLRGKVREWKEAALDGLENQRRINAALDRLEQWLLPGGEPPT